VAEAPFDIKTNLGPILADLKAINPKLVTGVRKALKASGDAIIEKQREILETKPVGGVVVKTRYTLPSQGRGGYRRGPRVKELGGARIVSVESKRSSIGYSRGLRDEVAANLTTSLTGLTSARGASVRVKSRHPFWANKALNAKKWRHPVFRASGLPPFVEQAGDEYFKLGVQLGIVKAREELLAVVEDAVRTIKDHPTT
jgi:hypothetical protein